MFNLADIDPNLLVAVEVYEDTLGDGEASQPARGTKVRTGYIDGVCVAYRSDGTPVNIE